MTASPQVLNKFGRVLVTGGSGYFGSLLIDSLVPDTNRIRVLDVLDADDRPAEIEFQLGDIRDPAACGRACQETDVVFHCVAQVPLMKTKAECLDVNANGTRVLLDAALQAGVRKVVYISSSAVYGVPQSVPITEETIPHPAEDYGEAKLAGEGICREFAERGLDITIIRPRTILGHGRLGIMQIVFEWVREGSNVFVLGRGDNKYQFVHADDLARACIKAAARPGFALYNVGAAEFGTMRETLEGLIAHAGTKSRVRSLPYALAVRGMQWTSRLGLSPLAPYHWLAYGRDVYFDISKAQSELEWNPIHSNIEMFIESYEWYLTNRDKILSQGDRSVHRSAVKQGVLKLLRWL
ncbi:MAG: NAD-dependent epimerase/dehydratase family protein [Pirellulales bacterium]